MPRSHFSVQMRNPNHTGACLCSPTRLMDCSPPYIVMSHTEMMDPKSPHPVLSCGCALAALRKAGMAPAETSPATDAPLEPFDAAEAVAEAFRALLPVSQPTEFDATAAVIEAFRAESAS